MIRILKTLQCLLLSAIILGATPQRSDAFFLMPPMPWDIEIDIPANAQKVISNIKALYRQAQTIKSELNTQKLEVLKKGQVFKDFSKFVKLDEKKKNKAPGKGKLANNSDLGITKGGLSEEENFNAYHKLFFVYPEEGAYGGDYEIVKSAYTNKSKEYKQDIVMETYLVGRVTEDYLSLVEKTIERLDNCQKAIYTKEEMEKKCVFFGLQMAYVEPQKEEPEGDPEASENPGQYGEIMNAYIVTTVYDRLLRIVQDLAGAEAQFLAAKQIELVDPIEPENTSNAEDYLDKGFRFAYNDTHDYSHAKSLVANYTRSSACQGGGNKNCSDVNEDSSDQLNVDDTEILGKLQPIDEAIDKAMTLHNLKAQLPEYKAQYRKYLKAKEIHERMVKVLEDSDNCVVDFLNKNGADGNKEWYGGTKIGKSNNYEVRAGISRQMIEEYQKDTTDTIIGNKEDKCGGFYESCPEGYRLDPDNVCESDSSRMACIVDTVSADTDVDYDQQLADDYKMEGQKNSRTYKDGDYLIDGTNADVIEIENRVKAEKSWRIGYNKIMELTENGTLNFKPWQDQKRLQAEYLRNKYRNMRMIVKAVDEGIMSYRVGKTIAENYSNIGPVEKVLPTVTACKLTTRATVENAWPQLECEGSCSIGGDIAKCSGTKKVECDVPSTCTRSVKGSDGKYYTQTYSCIKHIVEIAKCSLSGNNETGFIKGSVVSAKCVNQPYSYDQRTKAVVSGGCAFTKKSTTYPEIENNNLNDCPGTWDFSTKYLVHRYLPATVGSYLWKDNFTATCPTGIDAQSKQLYNQSTKINAGREVASDMYQDIFKIRDDGKEELKAMVRQYEKDMENLRARRTATIEARKSHSERVKTATDEKNDAIKERERSKRRIVAIDEEIIKLENRVEYLKKRIASEKPLPESLEKDLDALISGAGKDLDKFKNPTLAQRIGIIPALKIEKEFLKTGIYPSGQNPYENITDEEDKFIDIPKSEKDMKTAQSTIDGAQAILDTLQEQIDSLEEQIKARAEKFSKDYLDKANALQAKLEEAVKKMEDKLETREDGTEPERMVNNKRKRCTKKVLGICTRHSGDLKFANLKWTMARVLFGEGTSNDDGDVRKELPSIVKDTMFRRWFEGTKWNKYPQLMAQYGTPSKFVVANGCLAQYGVEDGIHTPATIAQRLREASMAQAVPALSANESSYIPKADTIIKNEIDSAVAEINAVMKEWGVTGEDNVLPNEAIFIHANYAKDKSVGGSELVTARHYKLIEQLKQALNPGILESAGIKLEESFGIHKTIITDDDYFVGLPARGDYDTTVPTFGRDSKEFELDENDGRDYMAPHRPLLNLAPLREVFYYSAMDYDDTPKTEKDTVPSRTHLIDVKYKGISGGKYSQETYLDKVLSKESIPEVWRYMLATPNFRDDGKYQQTFVERAYDIKELKKDLSGGDLDKHYRTIVSRAGIYPCKLGGTTIDMKSGDKVDSMSFATNDSVSVSGKCYEVANNKSGLQHLLADHDTINPQKSKAIQKSLSETSDPIYQDHSELGQFVYIKGNEKHLRYRPLVKNIYDYMIEGKNQDNNIERKRGETATFTRNVIGGFLEAVNAEHEAKKTMENNLEDVKASLNNLCKQIHDFGNSVNGEECEDETDTECKEKIAETCASVILDDGGLAENAEDNVYEYDCTGTSEGDPYYKSVFCMLDSEKDKALAEAKAKFSELQGLKFPEKVEERITDIKNYFAAFDADKDEVATVQPKMDGTSMEAAVKTAKADRDAARLAEDEGIVSMDNQSRAVPYCPVY